MNRVSPPELSDGTLPSYLDGEPQVVIQIQEDPKKPDRRVLLGLPTCMEPSDWKAHLRLPTGRVVTAPLDELGIFVLSNLAPGDYELILSGPAAGLHLQAPETGTSRSEDLLGE